MYFNPNYIKGEMDWDSGEPVRGEAIPYYDKALAIPPPSVI
jgi:hypothetical protein